MRVICRTNELTPKQRIDLDLTSWSGTYPIEIGKTYTVLGISVRANSGPGIMLDIPADRYVLPLPLCLFDIVDSRPSRYWQAQKEGDYVLRLQPEAFFIKSFFDKLSELDPEVSAIYRELRARMESEFDA